jgi:hypothetical protein
MGERGSPTTGQHPAGEDHHGEQQPRWHDTCCLVVYGVGWLGIVEQSLGPNLLAVCKKRSKQVAVAYSDHDVAQSSSPCARRLTNKQHNQAGLSRRCCAFVRSLEHAASSAHGTGFVGAPNPKAQSKLEISRFPRKRDSTEQNHRQPPPRGEQVEQGAIALGRISRPFAWIESENAARRIGRE